MSRVPYDEFSFFHENCEEWGLDVPIPAVTRVSFEIANNRHLSGLQWGDTHPEAVLVHGGAQNAHTFDTVAIALQVSLLALDLPGHGHSDPSPYGLSAPHHHGKDISLVVERLGQRTPLVGMSLGGLTSIVVASLVPEYVSHLVLIDITPGVTKSKAQHITDFVHGPKTFASLDELLERTIAFNPTRSVSSLRRGILHNALQRDDGSWVWRHQQHAPGTLTAEPVSDLWDTLERLPMPITLIRGMSTGSVVDDDDVAELLRRRNDSVVHEVANAGHSIQGDAPIELARILRSII
jgi:pimeloyl-ACP methyl ester carboxylesterase